MRHDSEIERLRIPVADYVGRSEEGLEEYEHVKAELAAGTPLAIERSWEYASLIINSIETGEPCVIYGNVRNTGLITNLPADICVEVPCLVDRTGVNPTHVGDVAPQCAALNRTFSNVCDLTVRAVLEGRRDHVRHAAMLDPNTAATLTLDQIDALVDEHARRLPRAAAGVAALSHFFDDVTRRRASVSAAIDAAEHEGPAVVVGIDGPGGAGKSTLARELALLRDDVAIIEGDDFYRPLTESTREALTPLEAVDLLFDWERLRDEALAPLLRGEEARYRRYDWDAGRLGEEVATVARARRRAGRGLLRRAARAARLPRPDRRRRRAARALHRAPAGARRGRRRRRSRAGARPRTGTSSGRIRGASPTS